MGALTAVLCESVLMAIVMVYMEQVSGHRNFVITFSSQVTLFKKQSQSLGGHACSFSTLEAKLGGTQ